MKNIVDAFNYAMSEIIDLKSDGFSINIIVPYTVTLGPGPAGILNPDDKTDSYSVSSKFIIAKFPVQFVRVIEAVNINLIGVLGVFPRVYTPVVEFK